MSVIPQQMVHHRTFTGPRVVFIATCAWFLVACSSPVDETPTVNEPDTSWRAASVGGTYDVRIEPEAGRAPIGEFHQWVIDVRDTKGNGVHPAQISMSGGMPSHGHGLPTQPQVTEHLGNGRYRIEGVKFNMAGPWTLEFGIDAPAGRDRVRFDLELAF